MCPPPSRALHSEGHSPARNPPTVVGPEKKTLEPIAFQSDRFKHLAAQLGAFLQFLAQNPSSPASAKTEENPARLFWPRRSLKLEEKNEEN